MLTLGWGGEAFSRRNFIDKVLEALLLNFATFFFQRKVEICFRKQTGIDTRKLRLAWFEYL